MSRWFTCAALLIALVAGCARSGDTNKNKDLDRPKPAEAGKDK